MFGLTAQYDYLEPHHARTLAWPNQVAERLRRDGSLVDVQNRAVTASIVGELPDQLVSGLRADVNALFWSGHNDLCLNPAAADAFVERFARELDAAVAKWDATHVSSRAHFIPVSRIDKVYAVLKGHVWHQGTTSQYRCEDSWTKFFPYCLEFSRRVKDGSMEDYIRTRTEAMDAAMTKLADKWNRQSKSNVFDVLTSVPGVEFRPEYFSVDCYHLSAAGQAQFAQAVFDAGRF